MGDWLPRTLFGLTLPSGPTDWVVRVLAVAGGAALGVLIISLIVRLLGRLLGTRRVPGPLYLMVRILGAIVGGWAVWLLVFGGGGSGIGGPGGSHAGGPGTGKGTGAEKPAATQPAGTHRANTLAVVMLGGARVHGDRFYQVAGAKEPLNLEELKEVLKKRQAAGLQGVEIVIYENSVSRDHSAVSALQQWALDHDLAVSMSFPKGDAP